MAEDTAVMIAPVSSLPTIAEVRQRMKEMAPAGGYILSPAHRMLPDVPFRNIKAMYEAGREHGKYPINL